jgi:ABC-type Fe3+/spermidine/putrescine transport system ATPase subunit
MMAGPVAPAVLELRGVTKAYGAIPVVRGIDLSLQAGAFMSLLGPSGSGKTTTLLMVAGLLQPDRGSIHLNGRSVDRLPPYRRDIGFVFQNYALFPHMTVRRNLAFPLEMRREKRERIGVLVEAALRMVDLQGYADRLPRDLSGGQQQRVALARAMIYRPTLLLMDEPLGALDRSLREQMQHMIIRLHREQGVSVLYVTHDQDEAWTMSDRVAVFNAGAVEQVGTPEELYERPASRFVAGFVGKTNFLSTRIVRREGWRAWVEVAGAGHEAMLRCDLPEGAAAVLAVRPERVRLLACAGASAVLERTIYLGSVRNHLLRLGDGQECLVQQHMGDAEGTALQPGARVQISWVAAHALVFER